MQNSLRVILVTPRFPENIGMAARACANMGVEDLVLVRPERWDIELAKPLATSQGLPILQNIRMMDSLEEALKDLTLAIGATARLGGWRQEILTPEKAAQEIREYVLEGGRAGLVFGSEDRGLLNEEIEKCTRLVNIPTSEKDSSLNLAQAVLILLYESFKVYPFGKDFSQKSKKNNPKIGKQGGSRPATLEEESLLFSTLQDTLVSIDVLPKDNQKWFAQPLHRYLRRSGLKRHEFDFLMGVCRQIRLKLNAKIASKTEEKAIQL